MLRVTLKDVARQAGVSPATVSRILGARESAVRISQTTRDRVRAIAQDLNYTPDALASGLRSQNSRIVGVIVRDAAQAYPALVISLLNDLLEKRGYHFLLAQARTAEDARRFSQTFERYRVGGVLFFGALRELLGDALLADYCRRLNGCVVGIACEPGEPLAITLDIDNRRGIELALEHLRGLGHRRIAFVGPARGWDLRQRLEAFGVVAASAGPDEGLLIERIAPHEPREGAEAMMRLLSGPRPPSAVIFATDELALVGIMAAQQAGYVVPRDVAVVGFDDIPWASYCWPSLTTVRQPVAEMVDHATQSLIRLIENDPELIKRGPHVFAPELVVRGSTVAGQATNRTSNERSD